MSEPKTKLNISDLKDTFLECPICVEHFNQTDRRPRLLHSCLHAFCTPCLQKLLKKEGHGQITCPLCRQIQKVEDNAESLPGDPLRSKLVEYVDVQKKKTVLCSECSEQRDAISRCQDCQTYLCKECDFIHRGHRSTRDHSPISVQEALDQPIKSLSKGHFCPKHAKHNFKFYCTTDEHLCCISCTVVDHKGHDLQSLEEAAASRIADIETSLASARGQADNLRESKKICKRNEKHIQNDMASTLSDINTVFDDLQTRLDRRRKMLIGSVKEKGNAMLSSVHKTSEALDETLAVIESTDTYFTQAKDKADVVEVLQIYPAMKRSLSNVQDIPPVTSSGDFKILTFVKPTKDSIDVFVSGFDARSVGHGRVLSSPSTATVKVNGGGHSARSKGPMRSPDKPYLVTTDLFSAFQHFLTSERLKKFCEVEAEDDHMAIYFLMDTTGEASRIKQRMMGITQEVISVSSSEASKAESVARAIMEEDGEVYIKYDKNRQVLTLFAEEWDKISKAKNRIQAKFGSSKVSSRGARKFGTQTADKTSISSTTTTSDPSHAPGVSSSPGTAAGKNITVRVYKANILQLKVDVIVNAASGQLCHGGGVARAIAAAAGDRMTREGDEIVRQRGTIPVTELAVTSAGKLPNRKIFHAVGPGWNDYNDKQRCQEDLCHTILRCLCEAKRRNMASIAIPAISSSILAVPRELCGKMYVRALKSFDLSMKGGPKLEVLFVDVSDTMVSIIQKELTTSWKKPPDQKELDADAAFINYCMSSSPSSEDQGHGSDANPSSSPTALSNDQDGYYVFSENVSISIIKGNIFAAKADAYISWEHPGFIALSPLVKELVNAGGDTYREQRKSMPYPNYNDVIPISTSGGGLGYDFVIHAVLGGISWDDAFNNILKKALGLCIKNGCILTIVPVYHNISVNTTLHTSKVGVFIECMVKVLVDLSRHKGNPVLHVQIVDDNQQVVDELTKKLFEYITSHGIKEHAQAADGPTKASGADICTICQEPATNPKKLSCGDVFCKDCIEQAFKFKKVCPNCKAVCGVIKGNMPQGTMLTKIENYSLPGFPAHETITITYHFFGGTQNKDHPHPGQSYKGANRYAYLPDNQEGRKVLALLKVAWDRRLTFTVGQSVTIGGGDRVTWNEIHHKTTFSGGPTNHGYPDADYLRRVTEELAAQGVTEKDLGATGSY